MLSQYWQGNELKPLEITPEMSNESLQSQKEAKLQVSTESNPILSHKLNLRWPKGADVKRSMLQLWFILSILYLAKMDLHHRHNSSTFQGRKKNYIFKIQTTARVCIRGSSTIVIVIIITVIIISDVDNKSPLNLRTVWWFRDWNWNPVMNVRKTRGFYLSPGIWNSIQRKKSERKVREAPNKIWAIIHVWPHPLLTVSFLMVS